MQLCNFFYSKHHQKLPVAFVPNYSVNCQSLNFLADDSGSVAPRSDLVAFFQNCIIT